MSRLSDLVLDVLEKYSCHSGFQDSPPTPWPGKKKLLSNVHYHVMHKLPIQLTLPAFPCKSMNRTKKVLGPFPDLGEELALRRLHEMGEEIRKVYVHGAIINVASDGVLFTDILGISDAECWDYTEALKQMIKANNFTNVRLIRGTSLMGFTNEATITKAVYIAKAPLCRTLLASKDYSVSQAEISERIHSDKDTNKTYTGIKQFLELELRSHPLILSAPSRAAEKKIHKTIALQIVQRSGSFSTAIKKKMPKHVRLSIHASLGKDKLGIVLLPDKNGTSMGTPWHKCVVMDLDGSVRAMHVEEVNGGADADGTGKYKLHKRNGRGWCFRET